MRNIAYIYIIIFISFGCRRQVERNFTYKLENSSKRDIDVVLLKNKVVIKEFTILPNEVFESNYYFKIATTSIANVLQADSMIISKNDKTISYVDCLQNGGCFLRSPFNFSSYDEISSTEFIYSFTEKDFE